MQYVAAHTSIPIPKVHKIHTTESGFIYIEMEYVQGSTLFLPRMSAGDKASVLGQLKRYVEELRALPPPSSGLVSSAFGNPAHDGRIGGRFFGPMSVDAFQELARGRLIMEEVPLLGEEVRQVHTSRYEIKFTHADLAGRNIIVRGGDIAAIIDWAYAGWYPEYWEFTKAHYVTLLDDWQDNVRTAISPYDLELAAEEILWRRLPEPGTAMTTHFRGKVVEHPGSYPSATWLEARSKLQADDLWSSRSSSMAQLVTLTLYDRGDLSQGRMRSVFGHKAYHWGVLIVPKEKRPGRVAHAFEATDASVIDPVTFRMTNPSMEWRYNARLGVDPELSHKLLGQLVVGEIPDGAAPKALDTFFAAVPLPVRNTEPQQGCVTWSINALRALQKRGWAWDFDLDVFKDDALAYADDRIKGMDATEPKLKYYLEDKRCQSDDGVDEADK
ncbi:hypothetical protein NHJ13051_004786 [Beauveria bassiana]